MTLDWKKLGVTALDGWNRLSMLEQFALAGIVFCAIAFAALYWTPLGRRGLAAKCLVLALLLHAVGAAVLELRPPSRSRVDQRLVRAPIRMTPSRPHPTPLLEPTPVQPQALEQTPRAPLPDASNRRTSRPRESLDVAQAAPIPAAPKETLPGQSAPPLVEAQNRPAPPEAADAPEAPKRAPTKPSAVERPAEPQFEPMRTGPIVVRRSRSAPTTAAAAPSLPAAETLDLPSPGVATRSTGPSASASLPRPGAPSVARAADLAPVPPPASSAERESTVEKTSAPKLGDLATFDRRRSVDERPVRKSGGSRGDADEDRPAALLASRKSDDLGGGGPSNRPFVLSSSRTAPNRLDVVIEHGGSRQTEQAVADALAWLAAHQSAEGCWDSDRFFDRCPPGDLCTGPAVEIDSDTGLTGLSLLAFQGAGETHTGKGKYSQVVGKALSWLVRMQRSDGDLRENGRIYCHSMATLALCEAYAMTRDERLREPAQKAVDYLARAQHSESGSWRYAPGEFGDTSVFGWAVLALHSAQNAGFKVPPQVWTRAEHWLPMVRSGRSGGLHAYRPGYDPSHAMTAEAMVCRQILGAPADAAFQEAGDYLLARLPDVGDYHLYYWYYGTLGMFQLGGVHWQRWNDRLTAVLLATQEKSGHAKGSWAPLKPFGVDGGRVFSTAASALCLEVYYRYLPMYQHSGRATAPEPSP